jgi:hypothetical protein
MIDMTPPTGGEFKLSCLEAHIALKLFQANQILEIPLGLATSKRRASSSRPASDKPIIAMMSLCVACNEQTLANFDHQLLIAWTGRKHLKLCEPFEVSI